MSIEQSTAPGWVGHARGSAGYGQLLAALFCAGAATFAQLYSPQAVLPIISASLHIGAADVALTISASTVGLAVGVIPWSTLADRIGRVKAMTISVSVVTTVGLLVPFAPTYELLLAGRFLEGLFAAGTTIGGLLGRLVVSPVAEIAGWRAGVFTVALLCGLAALAFVKLAPAPRGFFPSRRSGVNPEGTLAHRLATNLRSRRQLALFASVDGRIRGALQLPGVPADGCTVLPATVPRQPDVPGVPGRHLDGVPRGCRGDPFRP